MNRRIADITIGHVVMALAILGAIALAIFVVVPAANRADRQHRAADQLLRQINGNDAKVCAALQLEKHPDAAEIKLYCHAP